MQHGLVMNPETVPTSVLRSDGLSVTLISWLDERLSMRSARPARPHQSVVRSVDDLAESAARGFLHTIPLGDFAG